MVDIQRILCPIDLSDASAHALEHAAASARWYGAQLTVVHVYSTPLLWNATAISGEVVVLPPIQLQDVIEEVRRFCTRVLAEGSPEIIVTEGHAVKEIVLLAERIAADLLVMGTHGRGGFERLFLGSVTEKVLRTTNRPVLTVPPPMQTPNADPVHYKNILCPLDFSEASSRALEYALSLAKKTDACVTPLHVVEGFIDSPELNINAHYNVPEYRGYLMEDAMTRLKAAIADDRALCKSEPEVVSGKASREILRMAVVTQADLIVMGVHGTGAADRFGSTTHRIVREAPCPVLTLRAIDESQS